MHGYNTGIRDGLQFLIRPLQQRNCEYRQKVSNSKAPKWKFIMHAVTTGHGIFTGFSLIQLVFKVPS